jgi:hypothetical protein
MVAVAPNVVDSVTQSVNKDGKELSPKQQQRLKEQKEREAKKKAKRQFKALQKERRAAEKERKEGERERKMDEVRLEQEGKTPKEMEEEQRRLEEQELFEKEFGLAGEDDSKHQKTHVKKSVFDSNRLGGNHLA